MCINATKFNRKSGGAEWRDLRCAPRASQILAFSRTLFSPEFSTNADAHKSELTLFATLKAPTNAGFLRWLSFFKSWWSEPWLLPGPPSHHGESA
jgi:hypothetical protein